MTDLVTAFLISYARRSEGARESLRTWRLQAVSAVLFGVLAPLTRGHLLVLLLFVAEASGQALLAFDGWQSRHARVTYFRRTAAGLSAAWMFVFATLARTLLVLEVAPHPTWEFLVLGMLLALHVGTLVLSHVSPSSIERLDLPLGNALAGTAVVLAITLGRAGLWLPAFSQGAYALLLFVGAVTLRPSVAEALNLAVFSSALTLVP